MVVPSTLKICGTRHKAKTSDTRQSFITDTVNPQADIQPTWKCEVWVRDVDLLKPGCNKNSELNPFLNTKPVKQPVRMTSTASAQACYP